MMIGMMNKSVTPLRILV